LPRLAAGQPHHFFFKKGHGVAQLLLSSLVAASVREKISALCFEKKK
jgi:hypothetical protein